MRARRTTAAHLSALLLACAGCGGRQAPAAPTEAGAELRALDQTLWTWASATCDDGSHTLEQRGFEDRIEITSIGSGLRLAHELAFVTEGCAETVITWASADGASFRFVDQARVADTVERGCSAEWPIEQSGEIRTHGDSLEVRMYRSRLCGGYDIRHSYRRVDRQRRDDRAVIRRVVAGLVLRDVDVITEHMASQTSLVVPRPASEGGGQVRFEGRVAAAQWFASMVRSVAWIGARVLDTSEVAPGRYVTRIEYMDSGLRSPLTALLTLTFADGEIYEAQLVFASAIEPAVGGEADAGSPLPPAVTLPDTAEP